MQTDLPPIGARSSFYIFCCFYSVVIFVALEPKIPPAFLRSNFLLASLLLQPLVSQAALISHSISVNLFYLAKREYHFQFLPAHSDSLVYLQDFPFLTPPYKRHNIRQKNSKKNFVTKIYISLSLTANIAKYQINI
jgi:hypothetical protein